MSLPTLSRGFMSLFGDAKSKLNDLQRSMASILPSMPGMPVGKFYDLAIGIDIHVTTVPAVPFVLPVPHIGMVFDLMAVIVNAVASQLPDPPTPKEGEPAPPFSLADAACGLVKGMAPSVKVHGQWVANAGIPIVHLPGFILHVPFPIVAPMSESEMWMGSSTVLADGSPCSTQFHPALSCNTVGFPAPPRKKGLFKKPKKSLMAPTSMLSIITSSGNPVLVGGPPTIDLFQLLVKIGLKALAKTKAFQKITKKIDDLIAQTPLGKIQQKAKCFLFGEPVDAATGRVFHENVDFELPGPVPLVWERTYYSDAEVSGPLGWNWHHGYNMGILDTGDFFVLRLAEGREIAMPKLSEGETHYNRKEKLWWKLTDNGYVLEDASKLLYYFGETKNRSGYRMLSRISTKDGLNIQFSYDRDGDLCQITDSRNQKISVQSDMDGRICGLSVFEDGEETKLVQYKYDATGNMVETVDALGVSKYFEYRGRLLTKLTNQSGMSFYWEYEGEGDNARCVHTWGDDGVLEYRMKYDPGVTRVTNGLGHSTEYHYDERKLVYKTVDANGGVTRRIYNGYEEPEVTIDPEGLSTRRAYDEFGNMVQFTDENDESTHYGYDENQNLTQVNTPAGNTLSWEYDAYGRVSKRTDSDGNTLRYAYEGALLKTVSDGKGRDFRLEYSDRNDLTRLLFPNGLYRGWEYDAAGRLLQSRDVNGNYTGFQYDRAGNLIELKEADGNVHRFTYDKSGNLVGAKDKLHDVAFTYGPMGILKSRTQNGKSVRFGYDRELRLRSIYNEADERYRFELDGLGQVIKETGFDGLERQYARDGAGRVTKVLRPGKRWTDYIYDGVGNVVHEEHHDGSEASYRYNPDGLLMEALNSEGLIQLDRDRAGRIVREIQGGRQTGRLYDREGNCTQITSSLGADIKLGHDSEGNLLNMQAGENWQADWQRDKTGLELFRQLSGGVGVRTERDRFGREKRKSIGVNNIEKTRFGYQWGTGNRLLGIDDEKTGRYTTFDYDAFDNLIKAEYHQSGNVESIYRAPDAIGNLFESPRRDDRRYGAGGRLLEDPNFHFHYDCEGNLVFKEFKKTQGYGSLGREAIEKKHGIKFKATATGWLYEWNASGMLVRVVNPQQGKIRFGYDPLGRRIYKEVKNTRTCWLWDGNVPLHEWTETKDEPQIDIITWVFEEGSFVPCARLTENGSQSIVTDYLGTPSQMYDAEGNKTWHAELDIYGRIRTFAGSSLSECPFRYQGQYEDAETGLYYNRFRYYDPSTGNYLSQDPIGLAGNNPTLYGYVHNPNSWLDVFGLECDIAKTRRLAQNAEGANINKKCDVFANDLKAKMKKEGIVGEHIRIQNVSAPNVISKKNGIIGDTGFHEAIKVGDTVFDNLNPNGMKFDDWINDIDLPTNYSLGAQYLKPLEW